MTALRIRPYFVETKAAQPQEIGPVLWNDAVADELAATDHDRYQAILLEQYKLYVELADRVTGRRALANTFFLTLNTGIFALVGVFWKDQPSQASEWSLVVMVPILLAQCLTWFWVVRSHRQLNSGKWAVVGALEARLPASPWWNGEWVALGKGEDPARYWPLTHVEQFVPVLFALAYVAGFVMVLLS